MNNKISDFTTNFTGGFLAGTPFISEATHLIFNIGGAVLAALAVQWVKKLTSKKRNNVQRS